MAETSRSGWMVRFSDLPDGWVELPVRPVKGALLRSRDPYHRLVMELVERGQIDRSSARNTESFLQRVAPDGQMRIGGLVMVTTTKNPPSVETRSLAVFHPADEKSSSRGLEQTDSDNPLPGRPLRGPTPLNLASGPALRREAAAEQAGETTVRYWSMIQPEGNPSAPRLVGLIGSYRGIDTPDEAITAEMDRIVSGMVLSRTEP